MRTIRLFVLQNKSFIKRVLNLKSFHENGITGCMSIFIDHFDKFINDFLFKK